MGMSTCKAAPVFSRRLPLSLALVPDPGRSLGQKTKNKRKVSDHLLSYIWAVTHGSWVVANDGEKHGGGGGLTVEQSSY